MKWVRAQQHYVSIIYNTTLNAFIATYVLYTIPEKAIVEDFWKKEAYLSPI